MPRYIETLEDLTKKYENTYILYDKKICFVNGFDRVEDETLVVGLTTPNSDTVTENWDEAKVTPIVPSSHFFNPHAVDEHLTPFKSALLFYRYPKRQWKRSLCQDICDLSSPLKLLYQTITTKWDYDIRLRMKYIEPLINPVYPRLDTALEFLSKAHAIAVSPLYCLTLSTIGTKPLLCSLFGFIGEIDETNSNIIIRHPSAKQEVVDFVNHTNQYYWRVVDATS